MSILTHDGSGVCGGKLQPECGREQRIRIMKLSSCIHVYCTIHLNDDVISFSLLYIYVHFASFLHFVPMVDSPTPSFLSLSHPDYAACEQHTFMKSGWLFWNTGVCTYCTIWFRACTNFVKSVYTRTPNCTSARTERPCNRYRNIARATSANAKAWRFFFWFEGDKFWKILHITYRFFCAGGTGGCGFVSQLDSCTNAHQTKQPSSTLWTGPCRRGWLADWS